MIASPCINLCQMDPVRQLCRGCLRTIDEITVWSRLDDHARQAVLAAIDQRRRASQPTNNSQPASHV